ncbi:hypothetical protein J4711_13560, partial [Staphylococcus epidermidis]|nr:hypothetical protein [Staphylococcus epidermidis]
MRCVTAPNVAMWIRGSSPLLHRRPDQQSDIMLPAFCGTTTAQESSDGCSNFSKTSTPAPRHVAGLARFRARGCGDGAGPAGCGGGSAVRPTSMDITLLGFNDFHGNLEPPRQA